MKGRTEKLAMPPDVLNKLDNLYKLSLGSAHLGQMKDKEEVNESVMRYWHVGEFDWTMFLEEEYRGNPVVNLVKKASGGPFPSPTPGPIGSVQKPPNSSTKYVDPILYNPAAEEEDVMNNLAFDVSRNLARSMDCIQDLPTTLPITVLSLFVSMGIMKGSNNNEGGALWPVCQPEVNHRRVSIVDSWYKKDDTNASHQIIRSLFGEERLGVASQKMYAMPYDIEYNSTSDTLELDNQCFLFGLTEMESFLTSTQTSDNKMQSDFVGNPHALPVTLKSLETLYEVLTVSKWQLWFFFAAWIEFCDHRGEFQSCGVDFESLFEGLKFATATGNFNPSIFVVILVVLSGD